MTEPRPEAVLRALLMAAAHCQGGGSTAVQAIAGVLDIPFPVRMESLRQRAVELGFDPVELWPWMKYR